jgi:hypothetical protein
LQILARGKSPLSLESQKRANTSIRLERSRQATLPARQGSLLAKKLTIWHFFNRFSVVERTLAIISYTDTFLRTSFQGRAVMSVVIAMDQVPSLLQQIASLRTDGKPWPEVAQGLKWTVEKVRSFVWEHEAAYGKILKRARKAILEDCFLDAVRTLQQQLKSTTEKIRQSAATWLTRIWMAQQRLQKPRSKPAKSASATPTRPVSESGSTPTASISAPMNTTPPSPQTNPVPPTSNGKTISSDQVLKWLSEKKIGA